MTQLWELMAHLAAVASLEGLKSEPDIKDILASLAGKLPEVRDILEPYNVEGHEDTAALALEAWRRGPKDLGRQYQLARKRAEKKALGQVFTPREAVRQCLKLLPQGLNPETICDPACGAGDFLLEAAKLWPGAKLSGWDIDPLVLLVAHTRLKLAGVTAELYQADALILLQDKPSLAGAFDLVLGNPPWGGKVPRPPGFTIDQRAHGNPFVWFLELSHWLLARDGFLSLVLPEAWLKVHSYTPARAWFLERFGLKSLCYSPKLFTGYYVPALLLSAQKGSTQNQVTVYYQPSRNLPELQCNIMPPAACQASRININYHGTMEEIWAQCQEGAVFLQEGELGKPSSGEPAEVDFSLGIVTGNNRDYVDFQKDGPDHLPLLVAADVTPMEIKSPSRWLRYDGTALQQAAPLAKYQVPEKIVYRFIAREIICAVDRSGALTLNSLNIMVPLKLPFSLDYLAALLNSELLNTLYMYRFFTGKVLTRNLKQMPLAIPTLQTQKNLVEMISKGEKNATEELVFDLYKISRRQKRIIWEKRKEFYKIFCI